MLSNSIANQGSIWHWARDHRVHHKHSEVGLSPLSHQSQIFPGADRFRVFASHSLLRHSDCFCFDLQTNADPHNATRGFFFAHMGWLFVKKHPDVIEAGKKLTYDDLLDDSTVTFQKNLDPWFALFMCFVFPGLVCTLWGDNFWNGYWVAGALRYIVVLHFTWLVNSAAHLYGDHPYDTSSWTAENPFVSLGALGEGWHNWHHKYPFDYAASEFGVDRQFNPTKLFCIAVGLASEPKRATGAWNKLRMIREKEIYVDGQGETKKAK
jgi:stearoyl-CoA desaturase (Delta-9 desaturase)